MVILVNQPSAHPYLPLLGFPWSLKLSHLHFPDETQEYGDSLGAFAAATILCCNRHKRQVFIAGTNDILIEQIRVVLSMDVGAFPIRYLGVPLVRTRIRAMCCQTLSEKILDRLRSWIVKFLFYTCR